MPQGHINFKSITVHIMAWCHQATNHYMNQCSLRCPTPYGVTRPQWVKLCPWNTDVLVTWLNRKPLSKLKEYNLKLIDSAFEKRSPGRQMRPINAPGDPEPHHRWSSWRLVNSPKFRCWHSSSIVFKLLIGCPNQNYYKIIIYSLFK